MTSAFILAYLGAGFIAISSAAFGVGLARILWAEDLQHAQKIDEIRSRTELSLRSQIDSLQRQLDLKK